MATGEAFLKPVQGWFSSPFGYRQDPFTGMHTFHRGVDMAAPLGTRVRATLDGTVTAVGEDAILGLHIVIQHQMGYTSVYGHVSRVLVRRGQLVRRGDRSPPLAAPAVPPARTCTSSCAGAACP